MQMSKIVELKESMDRLSADAHDLIKDEVVY